MNFNVKNVPSDEENVNPMTKILKTEKVFMLEMSYEVNRRVPGILICWFDIPTPTPIYTRQLFQSTNEMAKTWSS